MPAKYTIHASPAAPRRPVPGKLGIVDWREDCANCHNCVKRDCVYGFYRTEADTLHEELGFVDYIYQCKGCLMCVQSCTKNILTRVVNPEYERLGDEYYTPEIVLTTWHQAETGHIPVSGSGYGGRFSGRGFDSMWTDMSEIVRPTRDGIHGREYISTSVDIGRKLPRLAFEDGRLSVEPPPLAELPVPFVFDQLPAHFQRGPVVPAIAKAAVALKTAFIVSTRDTPAGVSTSQAGAIPLIETENGNHGKAPIAMVQDNGGVAAVRSSLKEANPSQVVAIRVAATPAAAERVVQLAREGAEVIHLVFDAHGREDAPARPRDLRPARPRHMRDVIREVHGALLKDGTRDEVTLIASGGIALPEHVAKAIICGADLVAIDLPLVIALECRLCGECARGEDCPVRMEDFEEEWGVQRIVNLMASWQNQLLEMLGAMGIREVRRLRGETGRGMFFEDLEAQTFGRLFGARKGENGA